MKQDEPSIDPAPEVTDDGISAAELDMLARVDESLAVVEGDDLSTAPVDALVLAKQEHALDLAPVNSKIVVVKSGDPANPGRFAVLMTPNGEQKLESDDPAHKLAEGARIVKKAEGQFISAQLSPADDRPDLLTATAAEAIAKFNQHFHDVKP